MSDDRHKALGAELYNKTWELFGGDPDALIHTAHASAYHWMQAGTAANRARSEWLCARVYSELGRPEPALHHARRCLELVEANPEVMEDWDLAGAYEALARAHKVAGNSAESARFRDLGLAAVAKVEDPEDRVHIEGDLAGI